MFQVGDRATIRHNGWRRTVSLVAECLDLFYGQTDDGEILIVRKDGQAFVLVESGEVLSAFSPAPKFTPEP